MTSAGTDRQPTLLSDEEMWERFAHEVKRVYGMSVNDFLAARKAGTLPWKAEGSAVEMYIGDGKSAIDC